MFFDLLNYNENEKYIKKEDNTGENEDILENDTLEW